MEKRCCYEHIFPHGKERPIDCTGVLAQCGIFRENYEEGFYVQTCPRTSWGGRPPSGIDFCGNGSDVVIIYQSTPATQEEANAAVDYFLNDW